MTWQIRQESNSVRSILVPSGSDVQSLPEEFRRLIDTEHQRVLAEPRAALLKLADRCQVESMKAWFLEIANRSISLLVHRWEPMAGHFQNTLVFYGMGMEPGFCLAVEQFRCEIPELTHLFSLISRTIELDPDMAGGLEFCKIAIESWVITTGSPFETDQGMTEFYKYPNGDALVAKDGNAYFYSHEINTFQLAGPISEIIDEYFRLYVMRLKDPQAVISSEVFSANKFYLN